MLAAPDVTLAVRDHTGSSGAEERMLVLAPGQCNNRNLRDRTPSHGGRRRASYHWTADTFHRACDAGVFGPDARLELIHGRIVGTYGTGAASLHPRRHSLPSAFVPL